MILPDGYSDIPDGKVGAIVTHLEMTARPAPRPDPPRAWTLRRVETPPIDWFRDLYRRIGEEWLWVSRIRMSDAELGAHLHAPQLEVYALADAGSDEGLLELNFAEPGQCEIVMFGVTAKLVGSGAGSWLMNRALEIAWSRPIDRLWLHTCTLLHPRPSRRARLLPALRLSRLPAASRGDGRSAAGRHCAARCRGACAGD
jgi:GNAT superfamily N-acetyltransferase